MKRRKRKISMGKYGIFRYYCPICNQTHYCFENPEKVDRWCCPHVFGIMSTKHDSFTWKKNIKSDISISSEMRVLMKPLPHELKQASEEKNSGSIPDACAQYIEFHKTIMEMN